MSERELFHVPNFSKIHFQYYEPVKSLLSSTDALACVLLGGGGIGGHGEGGTDRGRGGSSPGRG